MSDEWIEHDGGPIPVNHYARVKIKMRNGAEIGPDPAWLWDDAISWWQWRGTDHGYDIVAYKRADT